MQVFWYLVQRCITGEYSEPYSEYKQIKFGFQAMIMCATRDLRPSISAFCPPFLSTLIKKCWDKVTPRTIVRTYRLGLVLQDPLVRPTVSDLLLSIESLKEEYEE